MNDVWPATWSSSTWCACCSWTHFVSAVLVPFYRDWGGLTFTQILLVNAWFMVWNFLLEVPTGTVADVWGRKASLVLGALVGAGAALFYVSAPSLPRFLLAEVFFAASFTLMSGADEAMLYDTLDDLGRTSEAGRRYGHLAAFQQVGIVIGALLGGVIAVRLGLRAPLALQSLPMLAAAAVALTMVEPGHHREEDRVSYSGVLSVGVRAFFASPQLKRLAIDMTVVQALAWMIIWLYQPALESAAIPLIAFGVVHTGMSLAQILLLSNVERLSGLLGGSHGRGAAATRRLLAAGRWWSRSASCFLLCHDIQPSWYQRSSYAPRSAWPEHRCSRRLSTTTLNRNSAPRCCRPSPCFERWQLRS